MKSLKEVLEGIEAFKKDMEDLGVDVTTSVMTMPTDVDYEVALNLRILMRKDISEDLEDEIEPDTGWPHKPTADSGTVVEEKD